MLTLHQRLQATRRGYARETLALFGALTATLALAGWLIGGALGALLALAIGLVMARTLASLGTARLMRLQGAVPLSRAQAPELARMVDRLAGRAGLAAAPQLYLAPGRVPNAFAAGSREAPAVALSNGLVQALDHHELEGVIAHEIAHLQAGDTEALRLAGSLVEATRTVGQAGLLACILQALSGEPVPVLFPLAFFAAPYVGVGLQFWLMRRREFAADATALALTGDASGLARALARLQHWRSRLRRLGFVLGAPPSWMSTHPETGERLRRLQELQPEAFRPRPRATPWRWAL